jgi:SAM-dependent methyltransferase
MTAQQAMVSADASRSEFNYSDGDAVENRLLEALRSCRDVSAASEELRQCISDWPSEYHFSQVRHNLLRPFNFGPTDRILELGCGCGALTRYLGETGAQLVAVDGSERRTAIARERCRDLPGVTIHCTNLADFHDRKDFDYVLLIGVLEYAPLYIAGNHPARVCLEHAVAQLGNGGTLILAIENQLGLKYFSGCDEDHLAVPYYGINGLYREGEPVTFGRSELVRLLKEAGLARQKFFYPFPDYKLPAVVLGESALRDERINIADLLLPHIGRNYPEHGQRVFAESLAWRTIIANDLLPDLANSFLVAARIDSDPRGTEGGFASVYGNGRRRSCYQVATSFFEGPDGMLRVRKRSMDPAAPAPKDAWLRHVLGDSAYRKGLLSVVRVHAAMARGAGLGELTACFLPWLEFLLKQASDNARGEPVLPGQFVDCIPANLIETPDSQLHYFDAEWVSPEPVPLAWIVIRGIFSSLVNCLENRALAHLSYRQLMVAVAEQAGIALTAEDFNLGILLEERMQHQCLASTSGLRGLREVLDQRVGSEICLSSYARNLRAELAAVQAEVARMTNTISWRLTGPFRALYNLFTRSIASESK